MAKKLIWLISTEGKSAEQIQQEALEAMEKFERTEEEIKKMGGKVVERKPGEPNFAIMFPPKNRYFGIKEE